MEKCQYIRIRIVIVNEELSGRRTHEKKSNYYSCNIVYNSNCDEHRYLFKIEDFEIKGYDYNKEIKLVIEKAYVNNSYIGQVKEVYIDNVLHTGTHGGWNYDNGNYQINTDDNYNFNVHVKTYIKKD